MSKIWNFFSLIKLKLKAIPFQSLKIGQEIGISAKDCVGCRIIPVSNGKADILLILDAKNGIEEAYKAAFELEEKIKELLTKELNYEESYYDVAPETPFFVVQLCFNYINFGECNASDSKWKL
jgi:hypothetical protein